ncbi:general transcription factor IIH subunit 2 [Bacillus rossius redtenbacheri]|uniref:general transcription factor IIH subunit 2 n=1 Tax=Bacillus rossius redtenbacheri TaxID=93214 RepID=UPI002FDCF043
MAEEDDGKEYRWESGYEKTWEAIQEDDEGLLEATVAEIIQRAKRKRQAQQRVNVKLGMMRHLYIILDCSECMNNQDLKPTRQLCTIKILEGFVEEFFDQNPISQLGIITTRNKRAEKISELAGNSRKHIMNIQKTTETPCAGEPSLQNALELALKSLKMLPSHASREVLVLMGSLTTCDPGDITVTIKSLKSHGVRCSVIGLAAEVHVCRLLARETGGTFGVVVDDRHFRDQVHQAVGPPPAAACLEASLVKMGFPHQAVHGGKEAPITLCMCHMDEPDGEGSKLNRGRYSCPQCCSKYCELPVECRACGLTLVSAPHLARSYHHLFPVEAYKEQEIGGGGDRPHHCFACQRPFVEQDKHKYQCPTCLKIFCIDCDLFVHEALHTCPGCATSQHTFQVMGREVMPVI